jgi:hypothetical protein
MKLNLLQGQFEKNDALHLITQFVHAKIRYHEDKIMRSSSEEDIKMRENRIKELQRDLYELRKTLENSNGSLSLSSVIEVDKA